MNDANTIGILIFSATIIVLIGGFAVAYFNDRYESKLSGNKKTHKEMRAIIEDGYKHASKRIIIVPDDDLLVMMTYKHFDRYIIATHDPVDDTYNRVKYIPGFALVFSDRDSIPDTFKHLPVFTMRN